ncbi:hypothetical protein Leryth_018413 [Lithospermum erythrorhizon]|nr:hypothetical protein Leryth_018413 [Lithospermum erythrorhizon]
MKRKREDMVVMGSSEVRSAIEELSVMVIKSEPVDGVDEIKHVPLKPFLVVCNLVIQILDKIGPRMAVLRQDIYQNIQRLEKLHESNPSLYSNVVEILKKEIAEGKAKKGPSCSKAFVWLTRSLDFCEALLQILVKDFGINMEKAVEESYNLTLKPWHGWISAAAHRVALKLIPDNKTLLNVLMAKDQKDDKLKEELLTLISFLQPKLKQIHTILGSYELDRLKSA